MNREIKFRAWSTRDKLWCGAFSIHKSGLFSEMINAHIEEPQHIAIADAHWQDLSKENPDGIILMQFTGLKDKNGKEIYEGDVVRVGEFENDSDSSIHQVKWFGEEGYPAFDLVKWGGEANALSEISQGDNFECEVIGNVYENPELLK